VGGQKPDNVAQRAKRYQSTTRQGTKFTLRFHHPDHSPGLFVRCGHDELALPWQSSRQSAPAAPMKSRRRRKKTADQRYGEWLPRCAFSYLLGLRLIERFNGYFGWWWAKCRNRKIWPCSGRQFWAKRKSLSRTGVSTFAESKTLFTGTTIAGPWPPHSADRFKRRWRKKHEASAGRYKS